MKRGSRVAGASQVLAVVSLVLGLAEVAARVLVTSGTVPARLVLGFLILIGLTIMMAIAGSVLGIVALHRTRKGGPELGTGRGRSRAALAVCLIVTIGLPLSLWILLPTLGRARDEIRKPSCEGHLGQLVKGAHLWMLRYGDQEFYPPSLKRLQDTGIVTDPAPFLCPDSATHLATDYQCILDIVGRKIPESVVPGSMPFAWNKEGTHKDGRYVAFFDGHTEFVPEDEFVKMIIPAITKWLELVKGHKAPRSQ